MRILSAVIVVVLAGCSRRASPRDGSEGPAAAPAVPAFDDASVRPAATRHDAAAVLPPCPPDGPCRVLPLGDSITFGAGGSPGGYRVPLFRIARERRVELVFVGRQKNGPPSVDGAPFPQGTRGIPVTRWTRAAAAPGSSRSSRVRSSRRDRTSCCS